jgi:uncharacterized membrane-anchored protein YhcB (DUF1043 family)
MDKTKIWHWIERAVSLSAIIGLAIGLIIQGTKWRVTVEELKISDEKQEEYIKKQNEINGQFIILYDYFINGARTEEGED